MGSHDAARTPSVDISGKSSFASAGDSSSSGRPKVLAHPTWRRSSSSRSGVQARRRPPHSIQPGSNSDSAARRRYSSTLSIIIRVSDTEPRSWPTSPAEWNVEPLVSSLRSSSTTSRSPSWARW